MPSERDRLQEAASRCVTHHHACDCREYEHAQAVAAAYAKGVEDAARRFTNLADGYHFAGELRIEKTIRDVVRALTSETP